MESRDRTDAQPPKAQKPLPHKPAQGARAPADEYSELVGGDAPDEPSLDAEEPAVRVRLNKLLADHGVASRRRCDELIQAGQVTVDGEVVNTLGTRVDPETQTVEIAGFILKPSGVRKRYYLLNKPSGVVCTNSEREMRPRAVDLITDPRRGRIYTIGRLDEESKGLILLTNDGEFAQRIMHPRYGVEKTYLVRVLGKIDDAALQKIRDGIHLSEGRTAGARVLVHERQRESSWLSVTIHEGMNREIRRSFARVGFKVTELKRTSIGPLNDRGLRIGRWRELTRNEVEQLRRGEPAEPSETLRPGAKKIRRAPKLKRPPRSFSSKSGLARVQTGARTSAAGSVSHAKLKRARREVEARREDAGGGARFASRGAPGGPRRDGPGGAGPRRDGPRPAGPRSAGPRGVGARSAGSRSAGSRSAGPRGAGPRRDGPRSAGPRDTGQRSGAPRRGGPR